MELVKRAGITVVCLPLADAWTQVCCLLPCFYACSSSSSSVSRLCQQQLTSTGGAGVIHAVSKLMLAWMLRY